MKGDRLAVHHQFLSPFRTRDMITIRLLLPPSQSCPAVMIGAIIVRHSGHAELVSDCRQRFLSSTRVGCDRHGLPLSFQPFLNLIAESGLAATGFTRD